MKRRIVLAGGTGFLGKILAENFLKQGHEVVVLTRSPQARADGAKEVFWNGRTSGDWAKAVDGADAVVNLAGKSVDCRYTKRNRQAIIASRVDSTHALGEAIAQCQQPPGVWLNSSTATIYKHAVDRPRDEAGEIGATPEVKDEFSIEVARAWEDEFQRAETPRTRKVTLRTAMVFGVEGGVFPVLSRLARFGLGGKMAGGRQFVSWIHGQDFCRAIEWLMANEEASGIFNLASPIPVTNSEMMRLFRKKAGCLFGLPAPSWLLEIGAFFIRTETELILKSRRVVPGRLLAAGFQFRFQKMEDALQDLNLHG